MKARMLNGARAYVALWFVCGFIPHVFAQQPQSPLDGLDAYIEQAIVDWDAPGLAIAIVKDNSVVFAKGFGVREVGKVAPVTTETVFLNASTTKAFTTMALAMLVDEDKLAWDDPVTKYVPDFELSDPYLTKHVTVRDLVTHRVGVLRGDGVWYASPFDRKEVVRRARYLPSIRSFRAGYGYHNIMYITAGEVVEAVSGVTWDAFLNTRIFEPLGMQQTTTSILAFDEETLAATPHGRINDEIRPVPWYNYDNVGPAGSMNSNVSDMANWLRFHLAEGSFDNERLISRRTFAELYRAQTVIPVSRGYAESYPTTQFRAYGLGWFLQDYRGHKVVQHSGSLDGMRARVGMIPDLELGVVLFTNVNESNLLAALLFDVFDRYLDAPERDWSLEFLRDRIAARREAQVRADSVAAARELNTEPSLPIGRYTGLYDHRLFGEARVGVENDGLVLSIGPDKVADLLHWHYDTFRVIWRNAYMGTSMVTFALNSGGQIHALTLDDETVYVRE